ncbi:hypothetical protein ACIPVK_10310 [Paeniglutamicibacter sp. MACA_103]|uniref:hypothetical protein n=1 Tax=Paeniglutamicibacter sp. MACA_103 TaxID=3377337 RepID=UPI003892F1A2
MQPTSPCLPWCGKYPEDCDGDCLARTRLHSRRPMLHGRKRLAGIEAMGAEANELEFVVGTDAWEPGSDAPVIWTCLNFRHVVSDRRSDPEASLQTDVPGMRTIHAQLGRFLALVRSGDAHRSEARPGSVSGQAGWRAQNPAEHNLDNCQPWCRDHGEEGCGLRMTLALTGARGAENRLYSTRGSAEPTTDLLLAHAIHAPGAAGRQDRLHVGLDCWNTRAETAPEYQRDRAALLPVELPDLKRIHTRLGKLLADVDPLR